MHLEFFVEEPSAEAALQNLATAILGNDTSFQIHPFQGKRDLLGNLPGRLRAMAKWLPADYCVVVLADNDSDNCHQLKERLERIAQDAGLTSKSTARDGP